MISKQALSGLLTLTILSFTSANLFAGPEDIGGGMSEVDRLRIDLQREENCYKRPYAHQMSLDDVELSAYTICWREAQDTARLLIPALSDKITLLVEEANEYRTQIEEINDLFKNSGPSIWNMYPIDMDAQLSFGDLQSNKRAELREWLADCQDEISETKQEIKKLENTYFPQPVVKSRNYVRNDRDAQPMPLD
ncbi:MAG: hypothetical protein COV44_04770 [Deltaproteobacteria bacterium CG11_big_fil_rev_8_21_14_0_20_45_16]|nr:MAG: hypothetical protein COV44_04770 [Deltaproteobacteria bacterium CG11_big_fil_rev_8_21_14_0_20_45_16]